jgi:serine/threonine protein kinase
MDDPPLDPASASSDLFVAAPQLDYYYAYDTPRPKRRRSVSPDNRDSGVTKRRLADSRHGTSGAGCDQYELLDFLGHGSFGVVALVQHKDDPAKLYARKQLDLAKIRRDVIRKEVDLIRKAHHRHVVRVVAEYTNAKEDRYYIVMEPAADCNLEEYLRGVVQPKSESGWEDFGQQRSRLLRWMSCLAVALRHIHSLGIRHRDIKPENILVHGDNILFADFGTSFHSEQDTRHTCTSTRGTSKYLPPEAAGDRRFGRNGDIFSLGCVFWEMAEALSTPTLSQKFPPISRNSYSSSVADLMREMCKIKEHPVLKRHLPERFQFSESLLCSLLSLIRNMLNPTPTDRYTAEEVVGSLMTILTEAPSSTLPCCVCLEHQIGALSSDSSSPKNKVCLAPSTLPRFDLPPAGDIALPSVSRHSRDMHPSDVAAIVLNSNHLEYDDEMLLDERWWNEMTTLEPRSGLVDGEV